jgi:hypothetical protein
MNGCSLQQRGAATARSVCFRASGWHNQPPETIRHESRSRPGGRDAATKTSRPERLRSKDSSRRRAATATSAAAAMAAPSTAAAASSATASSATTSSAAASVAAPSVSGSNPYAACSGHFLVEDKESRQADVRDFLLSEDYRCGGVAIPPVAIEADAPPTSDKAPATPNAVTALLRPFALEIGFECDISDLSGWPRTSDWGRMSGVQTNRGRFSPSQLAAQAFLRLTRCLCVSRVLF